MPGSVREPAARSCIRRRRPPRRRRRCAGTPAGWSSRADRPSGTPVEQRRPWAGPAARSWCTIFATTRQDRLPAARIGRNVVVARRLFGLLRSDDATAGARASPRRARGPRPPGRDRPRIASSSSPARRASARPSCCVPSSSGCARRAAAVGHVRLAEHAPPARPAARRRGRAGVRRSPALLRGPAAQHEIFAAVLDALRARPRVFVVEDLHWADEATLDLVRFLARRIAALPLLLVLSYRDALGADHPLSPVLGDLVASPDARRLQLAPLSRSAVADAPRRARARPGRRPPPDRGQPVLRQPDPRPAGVAAARERAGRRAGPDRRAGAVGAGTAWSCCRAPPNRSAASCSRRLGVSTATVEVLAGTGLVDRHGRGVAFRHEIARSAVLDATAPGAEPALHAAMIDALEAVGGDPSVLAHHAAAAGRRAPDPAVRAGGGGRGLPLGRAPGGRRVLRDRAAPRRRRRRHPRRPARSVSVELYLTDRLRDADRGAGAGVELRRELGDVVAVGAAHTALSGFAWYAADRALAERHDAAAMEILSSAEDAARRWASPWPGTPSSPPSAATPRRRGGRGTGRRGSRTSWATTSCCAAPRRSGSRWRDCSTATWAARADLLAATDVGLRHRLDDLATTPMSNLCHFDVEQGRFAEAEKSIADALRISEERDTPICTRVAARGAGAAAAAAGTLWPRPRTTPAPCSAPATSR